MTRSNTRYGRPSVGAPDRAANSSDRRDLLAGAPTEGRPYGSVLGNASSHNIKSVVVVGAGGNIGSHLVPHLARMPNVGRVTLIDRDVYESRNLSAQDITPRDVGKSKAIVQARRLRRIRPELQVMAISDSVENVPLGRLRADVILACLDSRRARQFVNQFAWRLGVPWIDAGVRGEELLARVNVYVPGPEAACLECAWDERDYRAIEQTYPCSGPADHAAPTNAPSSLGALAASLQAIECQKLLAGDNERSAVGRQVLIDAGHHRHYVTTYRRNPRCRLADHEPWQIEHLDTSALKLTLAEALELGGSRADNGAALQVEGRRFVRELTCANCRQQISLVRLNASLLPRELVCRECGGSLVAVGLGLLEKLDVKSIPRECRSGSLRSFGLRAGEVFSIGDETRLRHFEIGCHG